MHRTLLHRATAWLALACYLAGTTVAGLFHHHHDLESCMGGVCAHTACDAEKCEHAHGHHHVHSHAHDHPHAHCTHQPRENTTNASRRLISASSSGCHGDCVACQLLSQKAVRAQIARLEVRGEQISAVSDRSVVAPEPLIADEHPARGPPAAV